MNWLSRVKVKYLMTDEEDHESVQKSMNAIADVLAKTPCFRGFPIGKFRSIPEGDDVVGPVDYANRLIDRMYDYADDMKIWIE